MNREEEIRKEIESLKTSNGGWTRERLARWGVPWPPPKGWKKKLLNENKTATETTTNETTKVKIKTAKTERDVNEVLPEVLMFTGCSSLGSGGISAWAVTFRYQKRYGSTGSTDETILTGREDNTTSFRMDLMAVVAGLEALIWPCRVTVNTASDYVVRRMTKWKHVESSSKHFDLWVRLIAQSKFHEITWNLIRGDDPNPDHVRCHNFARNERRKLQFKLI
jgi:ribonuclease HI